jgi:glycosyltransferase involved in cell wall biosynthesis
MEGGCRGYAGRVWGIAKMKVILEATPIMSGSSLTGVGMYTLSLLERLVRLSPEDAFLAFGAGPNKPIKSSNLEYSTVPLPPKLWNQLIRYGLLPPIDTFLKGHDVAVFFNFIRLPINIPSATVIHDLAFLHYPEYLTHRNLTFLKKQVPLAIKKSSLVITISNSTKQDIVDYYGKKPEEIIVIPPAAGTQFKPTKLTENVRKKYKIPDKYILFFGTFEPRKNIEGVLEAYAGLPANQQKEIGLVLAGGGGWKNERAEKLIREYSGPGQIIRTGYVHALDSPALYSGAEALIFPSHFEGFGMPIIEAMACGTPVITADNSSLPEAGGDAAIYVPSRDIGALSKSISEVISSEELRRSMSEKGLKHSSSYSWDKSAKQLLSAIHSLKK